jgi:hypothetical protein
LIKKDTVQKIKSVVDIESTKGRAQSTNQVYQGRNSIGKSEPDLKIEKLE